MVIGSGPSRNGINIQHSQGDHREPNTRAMLTKRQESLHGSSCRASHVLKASFTHSTSIQVAQVKLIYRQALEPCSYYSRPFRSRSGRPKPELITSPGDNKQLNILIDSSNMTFAVICRVCGHEGIYKRVSNKNANGNAGRPYYQCGSCYTFLTFWDGRGMDFSNPFCECGEPSRRQINGYDHSVPRGIHYVCNEGICFFYMEERNSYGEQIQVPKDSVGKFARNSYIWYY
jgi:hypothetical protein